jgi:hypothetical protein
MSSRPPEIWRRSSSGEASRRSLIAAGVTSTVVPSAWVMRSARATTALGRSGSSSHTTRATSSGVGVSR